MPTGGRKHLKNVAKKAARSAKLTNNMMNMISFVGKFLKKQDWIKLLRAYGKDLESNRILSNIFLKIFSIRLTSLIKLLDIGMINSTTFEHIKLIVDCTLHNIPYVYVLKQIRTVNFCFYRFNEPIIQPIFINAVDVSFGVKNYYADDSYGFNNFICAGTFPNAKRVVFGFQFNQPISPDTFPNATDVIFGKKFNQVIVPNTFPKLESIAFEHDYNQPIDPIAMGYADDIDFNRCHAFNQSFEGLVFKYVKYVSLNGTYNQPLYKSMFPNFQHIRYCYGYKYIDNGEGKLICVSTP
jgi:hypothetical protein